MRNKLDGKKKKIDWRVKMKRKINLTKGQKKYNK